MFTNDWQWRGKRVLITGAASGLGRAMAEEMGHRGAVLWLCDLDEPGLERVAEQLGRGGVEVHTARLDVTDRAAMLAVRDRVHEEGGPLDVLVNNAGIAVAGPLTTMDMDDWDLVMRVNVDGVQNGIHAFGDAMAKAPGRRQVVIVSSAAGLGGLPALGAYAVSKGAVLALGESLSCEHDANELGVTVLCPGFVGTNIGPSGRYSGSTDDARMRRRAERVIDRPGRTPDQVAKVVCKAVERNRFLALIYSEAWLMLLARRLPFALARRFKGRIGSGLIP